MNSEDVAVVCSTKEHVICFLLNVLNVMYTRCCDSYCMFVMKKKIGADIIICAKGTTNASCSH